MKIKRKNWRVSFFNCIIKPVFFCLFSHESPIHLARTNDYAKSVIVERDLKTAEFANYDELFRLKNEPFRLGLFEVFTEIWRNRPVRSAAIEVIIIFAFTQLIGISAVFSYSIIIFENAGIPSEYSGLATVGLGVFFLSGTGIALYTVNRFNRLTILFYCLISISVLCVVFAVVLSISGNQVLDYGEFKHVITFGDFQIYFELGNFQIFDLLTENYSEAFQKLPI